MRPRPRHPLALGAVLGVFCLTGCGAAAPADQPVVRDSAGITIIENAPGAAAAVPRWVVGPEPTLRIGVVDGDSAYQFFRVLSGARLSDGRIVVADGGSSQVRLFDPDGRVAAVQGRSGEGPGEYRMPRALRVLADDSIAVIDPRLSRVTILHGDTLAVARVASLKQGLMNLEVAGTLDDGRRLVLMARAFDVGEPGIRPQYGDVWTVGIDDDAVADSVLRMVHGHYGFIPGGQEYGMAVGSPIFSPLGLVAARGDGIVVGTGGDYELRVHDPDGGLRRIIRWHGPDRATDPAMVAAYKDTMVAMAPEARRPDIRSWLELLAVAERTPAHFRFLFDTTGRLWVSRWAFLRTQQGAEWWVFDTDGRMVATAEMPPGIIPLEIGEGEVLGRVEDEMGVEYVVALEVGEAEGG